jgi:uncharacterized protein (TIGR01777 family)
MVGRAVITTLLNQGHTVTLIHRSQPTTHTQSSATWPASVSHVVWPWDKPGQTTPTELNNLDALIHLAGEPIVGRWTAEKKQRIRDSRVVGTRLLAEGLVSLAHPPKAVVSASAIGLYGDRGDALLSEVSSPGDTFLANVAQGWEASTDLLANAGVRVCFARLGIVLSKEGGALKAMLPVFQLGGGGIVGNGNQVWSWVALPDVAKAFVFLATTPTCQGAYNVTAPYPATNKAFTKALGQVLFRPTLIPLPAFAAKLVLGEMADALLLTSAKVIPQRLQEAGFSFTHVELEATLKALLA